MTTFKIFAGTDIGLRANNEDNFTICPDLAQCQWLIPSNHQQVFQLSEKGSLLVVADGMGGQNAGEVASSIAIDTVQNMFSSHKAIDDIIGKPEKIKSFLKKVIVEADERIKESAKNNSSTSGMGSTIVMAWVIDGYVYVAWLGDSRAYCYVPEKGIARLSKDHSYVQKLVDSHRLTDDEAMVHPDSNIITRSLGDTSQNAHPDVVAFPLEKGEIILLCSDGLCGVCKDELIGGIVQEEYADLKIAKEKLIEAALANGGSDNITVALLQIGDVEHRKKHLHKTIPLDKDFFSSKNIKYLLILSVCLNIILSLVCGLASPSEKSSIYKNKFDSLQSEYESLESKINTFEPKKETLQPVINKENIKPSKKHHRDVESANSTNNVSKQVSDHSLGKKEGGADTTKVDDAEFQLVESKAQGQAEVDPEIIE